MPRSEGTALPVDLPEVPPGLSENLVELEGDIFRVVKDGRKKRLVPVRVRANLNPLNVAAAGIAALGGMLAATIAWHGVSVPGPLGGQFTLFKGFKETQLGRDINSWYERLKLRRSGGEIVESLTGLTAEEKKKLIAEEVGDTECQLLAREHNKAKRAGRLMDAAEFKRQAVEKGCPWAQ